MKETFQSFLYTLLFVPIIFCSCARHKVSTLEVKEYFIQTIAHLDTLQSTDDIRSAKALIQQSDQKLAVKDSVQIVDTMGIPNSLPNDVIYHCTLNLYDTLKLHKGAIVMNIKSYGGTLKVSYIHANTTPILR
jgi:hypothetical protein